jgi:hypothetical protein
VKAGVRIDDVVKLRRCSVMDEDRRAVESPSVRVPSEPARVVTRHIEPAPHDRVHRHISMVGV